jgi:hypothetical protein
MKRSEMLEKLTHTLDNEISYAASPRTAAEIILQTVEEAEMRPPFNKDLDYAWESEDV